MAPGLTARSMDTYGFPTLPPGLLLITPTVTGYLPTKGGPGFPIIHGDGRLFIMAGGSMILHMEPCGFPIMNGARDGLPGEDRRVITDGPPSDQVLVSAWRMEMATRFLITSGPL